MSGILDYQEALERVEGDLDLYEELLGDLTRLFPSLILDVKKSFANDDLEDIRKKAHTMKGAAAILGADDFSKVAFKLENASKKMDKNNVKTAISMLDEGFQRLEDSIKKYLKK